MLIRLGPHNAGSGPQPAGSAGQYMLVASGTVRIPGATLPRWSCVWVGPDEPALALEAGGEGAEVIAVQFPRAA